jgi:hypothetical protein
MPITSIQGILELTQARNLPVIWRSLPAPLLDEGQSITRVHAIIYQSRSRQ